MLDVVRAAARACSARSNASRSLPNWRVIDDVGRDAVRAGALRARGVGLVGDARARSRPDSVGSFAASISAAMLEPRPEIRTATRLRAMASSAKVEACRCSVTRGLPLAAGTTSPSRTHRLAFALEHRGDRVGLARLDHRDHADAAVEGAQHFLLGDAAGLRRAIGTPAAPARARDRCARRVFFGSTRGMLSGNPPPVMCASALTALVSRIAARQRLHVDARRREQRLAERALLVERRGRAPLQPGSLDDLAHQRKAVGVHARRGEAEHDVAGAISSRGSIAPRSAAPTAKPARS